MKRFFAIILASLLLLTACGKQVTTHHIEDKDWQVVTVQSTQDGSILFIGNSMQEIYPDAAVRELTSGPRMASSPSPPARKAGRAATPGRIAAVWKPPFTASP